LQKSYRIFYRKLKVFLPREASGEMKTPRTPQIKPSRRVCPNGLWGQRQEWGRAKRKTSETLPLSDEFVLKSSIAFFDTC